MAGPQGGIGRPVQSGPVPLVRLPAVFADRVEAIGNGSDRLAECGGGPNGASASPVLVMYQKGIEQGSPDLAAAIGVVLVIGVLLISLVNKRILERD